MSNKSRLQRSNKTSTEAVPSSLSPRPFATPTASVQGRRGETSNAVGLRRATFTILPPSSARSVVRAVGPANDRQEQEADTVARQTVQQTGAPASRPDEATPTIQAVDAGGHLQRKGGRTLTDDDKINQLAATSERDNDGNQIINEQAKTQLIAPLAAVHGIATVRARGGDLRALFPLVQSADQWAILRQALMKTSLNVTEARAIFNIVTSINQPEVTALLQNIPVNTPVYNVFTLIGQQQNALNLVLTVLGKANYDCALTGDVLRAAAPFNPFEAIRFLNWFENAGRPRDFFETVRATLDAQRLPLLTSGDLNILYAEQERWSAATGALTPAYAAETLLQIGDAAVWKDFLAHTQGQADQKLEAAKQKIADDREPERQEKKNAYEALKEPNRNKDTTAKQQKREKAKKALEKYEAETGQQQAQAEANRGQGDEAVRTDFAAFLGPTDGSKQSALALNAAQGDSKRATHLRRLFAIAGLGEAQARSLADTLNRDYADLNALNAAVAQCENLIPSLHGDLGKSLFLLPLANELRDVWRDLVAHAPTPALDLLQEQVGLLQGQNSRGERIRCMNAIQKFGRKEQLVVVQPYFGAAWFDGWLRNLSGGEATDTLTAQTSFLSDIPDGARPEALAALPNIRDTATLRLLSDALVKFSATIHTWLFTQARQLSFGEFMEKITFLHTVPSGCEQHGVTALTQITDRSKLTILAPALKTAATTAHLIAQAQNPVANDVALADSASYLGDSALGNGVDKGVKVLTDLPGTDVATKEKRNVLAPAMSIPLLNDWLIGQATTCNASQLQERVAYARRWENQAASVHRLITQVVDNCPWQPDQTAFTKLVAQTSGTRTPDQFLCACENQLGTGGNYDTYREQLLRYFDENRYSDTAALNGVINKLNSAEGAEIMLGLLLRAGFTGLVTCGERDFTWYQTGSLTTVICSFDGVMAGLHSGVEIHIHQAPTNLDQVVSLQTKIGGAYHGEQMNERRIRDACLQAFRNARPAMKLYWQGEVDYLRANGQTGTQRYAKADWCNKRL